MVSPVAPGTLGSASAGLCAVFFRATLAEVIAVLADPLLDVS
jgi:hypothetical protein